MKLLFTLGVIFLRAGAFDNLKYCNEGKILWAQMRFYKKEITNRINKLEILVKEFAKCRQYTETWMSWPTEANVARRHIIYQYQSNAICTENYLDLKRKGVGPSGHAFKREDATHQKKGTPSFDVATPDIVRPAFEATAERDRVNKAPNPYVDTTSAASFEGLWPTRRLYDVPGIIQPGTKCISYECARLPYKPHDQVTKGYNGCIQKLGVCDTPAAKASKEACQSIQDNEGEVGGVPTYCVWVNETFGKMKWPEPYGNGGLGAGYDEEGKSNANLLDAADHSGKTKRLVATTTEDGEKPNGDGKGTWAWIGATRFCAATNTLMHWISQQTLDIPESEHFIKQEAWCNVLEESIIHESIKTTEKREMGALLQAQCDKWTAVPEGAGVCQQTYACDGVKLTEVENYPNAQPIGNANTDPQYQVQAYGLPQATSTYLGNATKYGQDNRTTFGNPLFGNRYAVADVAQGYGQQNVAKMITSPTQLVAWLALKHLGIATGYGDSYDASVSRFQNLASDDAMIASTLMSDLAGAFHYATNAPGTFVGGWHYHDRNWNNADGTFNWTNAQLATGVDPSKKPSWFAADGTGQQSLITTSPQDWDFNDKHGPATRNPASSIWPTADGPFHNDTLTDNGVLPWNVGEWGHGTVKHEEKLRQDVVNALRSEENLAKYFSGLIADPNKNALSNAIEDVKNEWGLYDGIRAVNANPAGESLAQDDTTASYAAFSDFTLNFDENGHDLATRATKKNIVNPAAAAAWYKINNGESDSIGRASTTDRIQNSNDGATIGHAYKERPTITASTVFDAGSVQEAIREIQETAFRKNDVLTQTQGKNMNSYGVSDDGFGTKLQLATHEAATTSGTTDYTSPNGVLTPVTGTYGSPGVYPNPNHNVLRVV